ncbi:MAG: FHA domain-containing protein [Coriobacteriia bacterium]|nr:FHA domain-containing protein [Coriobacteriia bacterium]
MIDIILLAGRIALIALLYIFLLFAIKTGIGLVRGSKRSQGDQGLSVTVASGPETLIGTTLPLTAALVIGRTHGNDIVVADNMVSSTHARITPLPDGAILEDMNSTNGTLLNGMRIQAPQNLVAGDKITIGMLTLVVDRR